MIAPLLRTVLWKVLGDKHLLAALPGLRLLFFKRKEMTLRCGWMNTPPKVRLLALLTPQATLSKCGLVPTRVTQVRARLTALEIALPTFLGVIKTSFPKLTLP